MMWNNSWPGNKCTGYPIMPMLIFIMIGYPSCNETPAEKKVTRSFYYWKSVFKLTDFERKSIDSLQVNKIYLKFFDVDWNPSSGNAIPVAKLQVKDKLLLSTYHIVPTVFITHAAIQQTDSSQVLLLAGKIYALIKDICKVNEIINPEEIQIDCDWTAFTRKKYFSLLQKMRQLSNTNISATIRLHQIKFLSKSGVPPVSRGMLMCYNMGNLKNPDTKNSIIETRELLKYVSNLSTYPLPLDIALPLFDWKVLFRNKTFIGLIENIPGDVFTNSFTNINVARIEIVKDTLLAGYELKKGDILRTEESNIATITATANEIDKRLKNSQVNVALFHLDSVILNKFNTNELESIFSIFH